MYIYTHMQCIKLHVFIHITICVYICAYIFIHTDIFTEWYASKCLITDSPDHPFLGFPCQLVKNLPAMLETCIQFLGWEDPLEKEMATHSSILAWRILWTEEPGRLQSIGSQELDMTFFSFSRLKKKKKHNTQKNQVCNVWHCPWCKYSPLCLISSYHSDISVCWSQDKVWRVSSCEPIEAGFSTSLDGYTHCSSTGWIHVTYRSL